MGEQSLSYLDANFVLSYLLPAFSPFVLCVFPPGGVERERESREVGFSAPVAGRFWDLIIRFERGEETAAGFGSFFGNSIRTFAKIAPSANAPFFDREG